MLLAELVVESFGNPLDIECLRARRVTSTIVGDLFLGKAKGNRLKLFDERLRRPGDEKCAPDTRLVFLVRA